MVPGVPEPACTVTATCCVCPPAETEIVALPAVSGSTTPLGVTFATEEFVELHVKAGDTDPPVLFVAEAANCTMLPTTSCVDGAWMLTFATGPVAAGAGLLTFT